MRLFKREKTYRVVWKYQASPSEKHTDYVKAYSGQEAWDKVVKEHLVAIECISIGEDK